MLEPVSDHVLKTASDLRDEARRSRRLAAASTDGKLLLILEEFARDLENRAQRMEGVENAIAANRDFQAFKQ